MLPVTRVISIGARRFSLALGLHVILVTHVRDKIPKLDTNFRDRRPEVEAMLESGSSLPLVYVRFLGDLCYQTVV